MSSSGEVAGPDSGSVYLVTLASFHGVAAEADQLQHQLGLAGQTFCPTEILRAAKLSGLKARQVTSEFSRLDRIQFPAIARHIDGHYFSIASLKEENGVASVLIQAPLEQRPQILSRYDFEKQWSGELILITKRAGLLSVVLTGLHTYLFSHTAQRIDVGQGARLLNHLLALPISYLEEWRIGGTVARVRELENIRNFLTGSAVTLVIDLSFTLVFLAVMYYYSPVLTFIVLGSILFYIVLSLIVIPILRHRIEEKFNRSTENQAFLVESVNGIETVGANAGILFDYDGNGVKTGTGWVKGDDGSWCWIATAMAPSTTAPSCLV